MATKLKTIDIHQDYILFQLVSIARNSITTLCSYMQEKTPYGIEYEKAYEAYTKLMSKFDVFTDALQETVECRTKQEEEK